MVYIWKIQLLQLSLVLSFILLSIVTTTIIIIIIQVTNGFTISTYQKTNYYYNQNHNHNKNYDISNILLYDSLKKSKSIIKTTNLFTLGFQYQHPYYIHHHHHQQQQQQRSLLLLSSSLSLSQTDTESTIQAETQTQSKTQTNIVWIIDVENVRGKTGFALSHDNFLYGIQLWIDQQRQQSLISRSSSLLLSSSKKTSNNQKLLFGNIILVIDHGNDSTKLYNDQYGYTIVFSGPSSSIKADDVIVNDVLPFLIKSHSNTPNNNNNNLQMNVITSDRQLISRCYNVINTAMTKSFLIPKKKKSSLSSLASIESTTTFLKQQQNQNNNNNKDCTIEIISPLLFVTTIENLLLEEQQDVHEDGVENNNQQQNNNTIQNQSLSLSSTTSTTTKVESTTESTTTNNTTSDTNYNNTTIRQTILQIGSELLEIEYYLLILVRHPTTTINNNYNTNNNLSRKQRSLLSSYYSSSTSSSSDTTNSALLWMSNKHRKEIIQRRTILLQQIQMYNTSHTSSTTNSSSNSTSTNINVLLEDIMNIKETIRETTTIPTNVVPYDVITSTSNDNSVEDNKVLYNISLSVTEYNTLVQRYIQAQRNNYSTSTKSRRGISITNKKDRKRRNSGSLLRLGQPYKETTIDRIFLAEQLRLKLLLQQQQMQSNQQVQVQQYPLFAKMYCYNITDPSSSTTSSSSGIDKDSSSSNDNNNIIANVNAFPKEDDIVNNCTNFSSIFSLSVSNFTMYNNNVSTITDPVSSTLPEQQQQSNTNNDNVQLDLFQRITYDVVGNNNNNNNNNTNAINNTSGIDENMYLGSSSTSTMTTRRSRKVPGRLLQQQQQQQRSTTRGSSLHVLPFLRRSSNSKLFLSNRLEYDDTDIITIVNDTTITNNLQTTIVSSESVSGMLDVSSQSSSSSSSKRRSRRLPGRMMKKQNNQQEPEDIKSAATISLDTKTQTNNLSTRVLKRMNKEHGKEVQQEDVVESSPLYATGKRLSSITHLLPNVHPLRIVVISDTHGFEQQFTMPLPIGDILVHVGDYAIDREGTAIERTSCKLFDIWLSQQPHPIKIVIRGNHDPLHYNFPLSNAYYITTPVSCRIGQYKFAFIPHMSSSTYRHSSSSSSISRQRRRSSSITLKDRGAQVTNNNILLDNTNRDCDVVVSHIPPKELYVDRCTSGRYAGSKSLRTSFETMASKNGQVPFLLLCGHIHEGRGIVKDYNFASKKQQQQQQVQVQVQKQVPSRISGVGFLPGRHQQQVQQQELPDVQSKDKSKEELENIRYTNLLTSTTIINAANANPGIARSIDYNPTIVQLGILPNSKNKNDSDNEDYKTSIDNESVHIVYNDYDNDDDNNKRDNSRMLLLKQRHKRRVQVLEMDGQYTYKNQRNDAFFPPSGSLQNRRLLAGATNTNSNSCIQQVLLAVDLGLRTGICLYTDTGTILYYAHYNFDNENDLRTSIVQLLDEWESNIGIIVRNSQSLNDNNNVVDITSTKNSIRTPSEKKLYIRRIVIEGHDKLLKKVWNEIAIHTGRLLLFIQPEEWRNDILTTIERQSGESSKIASIYLAQRIISDYYCSNINNIATDGALSDSNDDSGSSTTGSVYQVVPVKIENDDLAESILLGFYVARRLQWITNTDPPINRFLER